MLSGNLSTFMLGSCFNKDEHASLQEQGTLRARFSSFQLSLFKLLQKNAESLKKITLKNNALQGSYFIMFLNINSPPFLLKELNIVFPEQDYSPILNINNPPTDFAESLVAYLTARGQDLKILNLKFNRPVKNVELDRILVPIRKSLTSLSISVMGDILETEIDFATLNEMTSLESFEIRDLKKVDQRDVKKIREPNPKKLLEPAEIQQIQQKITSKVSARFLAKLPSKITSLTIGSLVKPNGLLSELIEPQLVSYPVYEILLYSTKRNTNTVYSVGINYH